MKTFINFILEQSDGEIPFEKHPQIGWWNDKDRKYIDVYHGTHKKNLEGIKRNGISVPDPRTGMISTSPDPNTAHAYAAMSSGERRGEHSFRKAGNRAVTTPEKDRVVFKFRIPMSWVRQNVDPNLRGNIGAAEGKMQDKSKYDEWKAKNPKGRDSEYYSTSELRFSKPIPPSFYAGHSFKVKK
jgi:hypothetical protein